MWQVAIAALVLLAATFYPRGGGAGLVIPILPQARAGGATWLRHEGAAILSPSTDARFFLVRTPSDRTALRALSQGLLLIAVPAALCGSQDY